jgi:hypothetical protein
LGNLFGTVDFQPFGLNLTSTQGKNEGISLDFNNASVQYFLGIFALEANHGEKMLLLFPRTQISSGPANNDGSCYPICISLLEMIKNAWAMHLLWRMQMKECMSHFTLAC